MDHWVCSAESKVLSSILLGYLILWVPYAFKLFHKSGKL